MDNIRKPLPCGELLQHSLLIGNGIALTLLVIIFAKVAKEKGYTNLVHFLDDGISGVTMDRPGFVEMIRQLEQGKAAAVFVKDYCAIIGLNQKDLENQGILA